MARRTVGLMPLRAVMTLALIALSALRSAYAQDSTRHSWGFVNVKADSRRSDHLYMAYGYDQLFLLVGLVRNPRSGYGEQLLGVGMRGSLANRATHSILLTFCNATDARYAQLYYTPAITTHAATVGGTFEGYIPLDHSGVAQLSAGSVAVTRELGRALAVGPTFELDVARRSLPHAGVGLTVRSKSGGTNLQLDLVRQRSQSRSHVGVTLRAPL